jgi:hypothetical protein
LDSVVPDPSAVIRGSRRFAAVFRLRDVAIYDVPNPSPDASILLHLAGSTPFGTGTCLAPLSQAQYRMLTSGMIDGRRASGL